jgi:hypothetical protein
VRRCNGPIPGIAIMLIGYNTNVPYKGRVYHVQTEDSGLANPHIITLLYHQGAILRSVKTGYSHIIGSADFEEQLRNLMKRQHREMIRELIRGKFDAEQLVGKADGAAGTSGERVEAPMAPGEKERDSDGRTKSLDEILLEHISRKIKK